MVHKRRVTVARARPWVSMSRAKHSMPARRAWVVSGRSGCQVGMAGSLIRLRSLAGGVMVLCDRKLTGRVLRWPGDHVVVACVLRAAQARSPNMATAARAAAAMRAICQPGMRPMTTARARTGTAGRCTGWWMCPGGRGACRPIQRIGLRGAAEPELHLRLGHLGVGGLPGVATLPGVVAGQRVGGLLVVNPPADEIGPCISGGYGQSGV